MVSNGRPLLKSPLDTRIYIDFGPLIYRRKAGNFLIDVRVVSPAALMHYRVAARADINVCHSGIVYNRQWRAVMTIVGMQRRCNGRRGQWYLISPEAVTVSTQLWSRG